ncbi:MAG TPA: DUF2955 domain-containing protein [Croceibacterium sp.]
MTSVALMDGADPLAKARLHTLLRFGVGISASFVMGEAFGWIPSFLAAMFTAVLLANLPVSPPVKVGLVLMAVTGLSAGYAFLVSTLLHGTPTVLVCVIGITVFGALHTMAKGKAALPMTLLLLCISTVPVVAMVAPAYAGVLPTALTRGMVVAMLTVWLVHALWPAVLPPVPPPPPASHAAPWKMALLGCAIIMPLILLYLLFGLTDAMPVLITTVLLVATFEVEHGAVMGMTRVLGNLFGGFMGLAAYALLGVEPSLIVLGLLVFLIAMLTGPHVFRGGTTGATALMTCNSAILVLGLAILQPNSSAGLWGTRLLLFSLAWLFAVGMMVLFLPGRSPRPTSTGGSGY